MATLAHHNQSVSLHATPVGGSEMPERPPGSYVSAESLTNEANFSGQAQDWHVIGANGVTVRERLLWRGRGGGRMRDQRGQDLRVFFWRGGSAEKESLCPRSILWCGIGLLQ